ncbi:MAG: hypothetical protein V4795_02240 [Pseudomonadota bacterium]
MTRYNDDRHDSVKEEVLEHPVATGTGAVAGVVAGGLLGSAAAGAAVGGLTGPAGAVIGAVVGAVAGAFAGNRAGHALDPAHEDAYWRDNFSTRAYVDPTKTYDDYGPAYRYGVDSYGRYPGRRADDVESDLAQGWDTAKGQSGLKWDEAKHATRDAWQRASDTVERAIPGDSDRDGK